MWERLHSHWSVLRLRRSDLLVYLSSMVLRPSFSTAIRDHHSDHQSDHQMTTKAKMEAWKRQTGEIAGNGKTTGQELAAATVELQDSR